MPAYALSRQISIYMLKGEQSRGRVAYFSAVPLKDVPAISFVKIFNSQLELTECVFYIAMCFSLLGARFSWTSVTNYARLLISLSLAVHFGPLAWHFKTTLWRFEVMKK